MNLVREFDRYARAMPRRAPAVVVAHPAVGQIGLCDSRGFRLRGMSTRVFNALMRDEISARRAMSERGSITTWDGVLNNRGNGKADDFMGAKASQTTVANAWSSFFRSTGLPGAGSYTAIPGGAVMNRASTGAWPLTNPATGDTKYLLNVGAGHVTGQNIVLVADLLVAAGNIDANSAGAQTINTAALTRYTDGAGVMMTLEVTTALGAGAANVTITYTNQAGTAGRATAAIAMTASAITFRLQPAVLGAQVELLAPDYGVRSVQTLQFSAGMGAGGLVALLLYKPLLMIPTLVAASFVERSTPAQIAGIIPLVLGSDSQLGCLTFFVNTSTTSTGIQTYLTQAVSG
jgi:hypothetical protein